MNKKIKTEQFDAKEKAILDISLIEYNLSLTPEERLLNHQRAFETFQELLKARKQIYGEPKPSSETPA
jgi:hypothetical protein